MRIIYIHHGLRKLGNPPGPNDTIHSLGAKDAKLVGKILVPSGKDPRIKAIYTAPILRCKKTAELINKQLKVPIIDEPRFDEFHNVFNAVKGYKFSDGETWTECQLRIQEAIKDIVYKYDNNDIVLCVTSGVNIAAFINLAYHIPPSKSAPFLLVPSCSPIGFDITKEHFTIPATHSLKLQPKYFDLIKEKTKIYEIRLNDEKRQKINMRDKIVFSKEPNNVETITTTVVDRLIFADFNSMSKSLNHKDIGFENQSNEEIIDTYHTFYSVKNEQKYGVVAFKLELI